MWEEMSTLILLSVEFKIQCNLFEAFFDSKFHGLKYIFIDQLVEETDK
jgi:hypothetical protein